MRPAFLIACAVLSSSAGAASHLTSVSVLPAQVRAQLEARHGEIADRYERINDGCLVEPGMAGQRLAGAEVGPDRVQVDIEHGRVRQRTRIVFVREDGRWRELETTRFSAPGPNANLAAALRQSGRAIYTPLPTDGTLAPVLPQASP